jgi:hypothetical protein
VRGTYKVEWNSKAILDEIQAMAAVEESAAAKRVWAYAIKNVPVGNTTIYDQHGPRKGKFKWYRRRSPGTLLRSIRNLASKFTGGGKVVYAGDERLAYYAHWVEYGTIFFKQKRHGYRYLRNSLLREKRAFAKKLQEALQD